MPMSLGPGGSLTLRNASIPGAALGRSRDGAIGRHDIEIVDGRIAAIRSPGDVPAAAGETLDLDGGLALPGFADIHTHLDKGHIWPRKPNPDGSFMGALLAVAEDREARWSAADVRTRMEFALRCAYAHGTVAIRTHLDSMPPQDGISWDVFTAVREAWSGRIELQAVSLVGPDEMLDRSLLQRIGRRVQAAGGVLGGAIAEHPRAQDAMRNMVSVAGDLGLDLDLHCDESLDPEANALRHLAEAVLEADYRGHVLAGHCCAITVQEAHAQDETIARVAEAGIAIVSLPMCNLYLQDRTDGRTPLRRGVTLLREFRAAGVPVALASDNTRDPFYAYGDLDPIEVFREGARSLHFDHPQDQAWDWVRSIGSAASAIAGFDHAATIAVGAPADLVLFRARNWTELLARPQSDRIVLRDGTAIDTTLPDYRELDELME